MVDLGGRVRAMRWMLWAFRGGVILYMVAALLLRNALGRAGGLVNLPRAAYGQLLVLLLLLALAILALVTFLIPARLADPERLARQAGVNRLSAVVSRLQRAFMVAVTGAHAVALLGVALFLLNGRMADLGVFVLLSLAGLAVITPRQERWEAVIDAVRTRRSDWADVW